MLLVCQFPISDARVFLPQDARLPVPHWLDPQPREFVRAFGLVTPRRRRAHSAFADEAYYASARSAIRFPNLERATLAPGYRGAACAFRRLHCDGSALARVEVGLRAPGGGRRRIVAQAAMLGSAGLDTLLASVLDLPVRIQGLGSETKSLSLHVAGPTLARLFAEATRKVGSTYPPIAVRAVAPTLLVQYRESEVEAIPGDAITIDPKLTADVPLAFLQREHGGQRLGIWLLREGAAGAVQERNLRMALLRVHAEYHALRHVLALLLDKTLTYIRGSAEGERLQEYLNRATTMLPESYPGAEPDKAIAHVLHAYDAPMPAADRALIADALAKVRRQIAKKVERYLETGEQAKVNALPTARQIYIFVSYSHRDEAYVNESTKSVLTFLGGLEREGFVFWHDQKLYASELWDDRIKEELTRADIALILVSQHFLNSKYIRETEMPALLASRQMAGLSILPLMVSASDWQSYPWLVATQHVPRTGTLATEYRNSGKRDELYLEVLKTIRRIGAEKRTLSGGVGSS